MAADGSLKGRRTISLETRSIDYIDDLDWTRMPVEDSRPRSDLTSIWSRIPDDQYGGSTASTF